MCVWLYSILLALFILLIQFYMSIFNWFKSENCLMHVLEDSDLFQHYIYQHNINLVFASAQCHQQETSPSWTNLSKNKQKHMLTPGISTSYLSSLHGISHTHNIHNMIFSLCFFHFTITCKLQPFWCPLPLANFGSVSW